MMTELKRKVLGSVGLTLVALACYGCWSKKEDPKRIVGGMIDPQLVGKWEILDGDAKGTRIEITSGGNIIANIERTYGRSHDETGTCSTSNGELVIYEGTKGDNVVYRFEVLPPDSLVLTKKSDKYAFSFRDFAGRWRRIGAPPPIKKQVETGPIADAMRQVQRIEAKLAKIETIQKAAFADRDELVAKLRAVGVNSVADLKGNIRGQTIAENIAKLAAEIEVRERQLALIDTELLKAKAIVRRMEQEQAGLTQEEMNALALQLRDLEDRSAATTLPITPISVDSAVENALKATNSPKKPR